MNTASISVLLAILAYFGWGVGDAVSVQLFRKNDPKHIALMGGLYRFGVWLLFVPLFWNDIHAITASSFFFNIIAGLGSGLGYYFFGKAAQKTNSSLVAAIGGSWGASTLILSLIFLGERITLYQWGAILLVILGLYFVNFPTQWLKTKKLVVNKGIVYALLACIMWGICGAFLKIPARTYGFYWTSVIMLIPYLIVVLFDPGKKGVLGKLKIIDYRLFLLMVACTIFGDVGYNASLAIGGFAAIVGTIAGSYATLTTFLTHAWYKERLTHRQTWGVVLSLIGIVLIAYFSSVVLKL